MNNHRVVIDIRKLLIKSLIDLMIDLGYSFVQKAYLMVLKKSIGTGSTASLNP